MIDKPAKFLDKILEILSEDFNRTYSIQEIQNRITPIEMFGEAGNVRFSDDLLVDLREALNFLQSKNLVRLFIPFDNGAKISFEGYLKLKTNSFSKEIKEKTLNQTLQRNAWTIPIVISIIALVISIYNMSNDSMLANKTSKELTRNSSNE